MTSHANGTSDKVSVTCSTKLSPADETRLNSFLGTTCFYRLAFVYQPLIVLLMTGNKLSFFFPSQMRICRSFLVPFATKYASEDEYPSRKSMTDKEANNPFPAQRPSQQKAFPSSSCHGKTPNEKCFHSEFITGG